MSSSSPSSSDQSGNPSPSPPAPAGVRPGAGPAAWPRRRCRDVFWLVVFLLHLLVFGGALALAGLNRFRVADRFNIDRYANHTAAPPSAAVAPPGSDVGVSKEKALPPELTETYWKYYGAAGAVGTLLAWSWLAAAAGKKDGGRVLMRAAVHSLTAYLAVISVLCFWGNHSFWGVALAVGAALHFLYVMSVIDRYSQPQLHFGIALWILAISYSEFGLYWVRM